MKNLLTKLMIIVIIVPVFHGLAAQEPEVFVTWDGFEADKLASIWLIERFVSPGSIVRVLPKGSPAEGGIAFDMPNAAVSRTFNKSSFESLLDHYGIEDPGLRRLGRLIHDVEINLWERKMFKKSREIEFFFMDLIQSESDRHSLITKSNAYFDRLYPLLTHDPEKAEAMK